VVAALLQIDVEKDFRLWLLNLERNRSRDLLVAVGKKRKFERGDCWWGITAGCGLGTIRKLATLICSLGERKNRKGCKYATMGSVEHKIEKSSSS
jgi:hypothetical protein